MRIGSTLRAAVSERGALSSVLDSAPRIALDLRHLFVCVVRVGGFLALVYSGEMPLRLQIKAKPVQSHNR